MKDIRKQLSELRDEWQLAYENALNNPAASKPYVSDTSLVQINEVMDATKEWLGRVKSPSGFSPAFHLAKGFASVKIPSLIASAKAIASGQYNLFPSYISGMVELLSATHTLILFSRKEDKDEFVAQLSAEMTQGLSLLGTAQKELAGKLEILNTVDDVVNTIDKHHDRIIEIGENSEQLHSNLVELTEKSKEIVDEINDAAGAANEQRKATKFLLEKNEALSHELDELHDSLKELHERCKQQEAVIDSVLPRAASAGLAAAFSSRGKQLRFTKWSWMFVFVGSLVSLGGMAWHLIHAEIPPEQLLSHIATWLPLAAPLVWLGWFSAVQYGNVVRVQEDYAFKEATSRAFQGYRDHMEHLANISEDEAQSALHSLSLSTIAILAKEPLRVFGHTHQDATPANSLMNILKRSKPTD